MCSGVTEYNRVKESQERIANVKYEYINISILKFNQARTILSTLRWY